MLSDAVYQLVYVGAPALVWDVTLRELLAIEELSDRPEDLVAYVDLRLLGA